MKKLRIVLRSYESQLEAKWQRLSIRRQKKYVILFFAGYLLITCLVIGIVLHDARTNPIQPVMSGTHIQNPLLKKNTESPQADSPLTIQNKGYERQ